jgi:excisionase family DNA binding protein
MNMPVLDALQPSQADQPAPECVDLNQHTAPALGARVSLSPQRLAFSVKETAQLLGVSEKTVRRLVARKLLRSSRALRHLLIAKKEIERFLDETSQDFGLE